MPPVQSSPQGTGAALKRCRSGLSGGFPRLSAVSLTAAAAAKNNPSCPVLSIMIRFEGKSTLSGGLLLFAEAPL